MLQHTDSPEAQRLPNSTEDMRITHNTLPLTEDDVISKMNNLISNFEREIKKIQSNHAKEQIDDAYKILLRILTNVKLHPDEPKFRQLSCDNSLLRSKLTDLPYGRSLLINSGFVSNYQTNQWTLSQQNDSLCLWSLKALEKHLTKLLARERSLSRVNKQALPPMPKKQNKLSHIEAQAIERNRILNLFEMDRREVEAEAKLIKALTEGTDEEKAFHSLNAQVHDQPVESNPPRGGSRIRASSERPNMVRTLYDQDGSPPSMDNPIQKHQELIDKMKVKKIFEGHGYKLSTPSLSNIIYLGTPVDESFTGITALSVEGKCTRSLNGISSSREIAQSDEVISSGAAAAAAAAQQTESASAISKSNCAPLCTSLNALKKKLITEAIPSPLVQSTVTKKCELSVPAYIKATTIQEGEIISHESVAPYWVSNIRVRKLEADEQQAPTDHTETLVDATSESAHDEIPILSASCTMCNS